MVLWSPFLEEMGYKVLCLSLACTGMTNFAVYEVKQAQKRWLREINHHLEPAQFGRMVALFMRSLRPKRWHHLPTEVQEAVVAVATGNGQSIALGMMNMILSCECFPFVILQEEEKMD